MFDNALAHLVAQIKPAKAGVTHFDPIHRPQALRVMIETAVRPHQIIQYPLTGMTKRRMPEVMGQRDGLGHIAVQAQRLGDRPGYLGGLDRMGQARPIVVALMIDENLGFIFETRSVTIRSIIRLTVW